MSITNQYYDNNSTDFFESTVNADVSALYEHFLTYIPHGGTILDFGCGSGRDTKSFLDMGYIVEAIDGSAELCKLAREHTGTNVHCMDFDDLCVKEKFDGIWACASLLHIPLQDLPGVFQKMCLALKCSGIIYASFKYGDNEGERDGRYFTDMTDERFNSLISQLYGLNIIDKWYSEDVRPDREVIWFNVILRKG